MLSVTLKKTLEPKNMKSIIAVLFATVTLITSPSLFASGCSGSDHDHGDSYDKDHASVETDNERGGGNY